MTLSYRYEYGQSTIVRAAVIAAFCIAGAPAQAQIVRGFIGAHEYALPDPAGMKPWNVFVEYSTLQNTTKAWNSSGDKVGVGKTEVLVSLSKFVHFWEAFPGVGVAMELIVPKVSIRDKAGHGAGDASGIADPIVGPAWWIKPAPNWTLGSDFFFVQIPVGDKAVSGRAWNVIGSVFWDGQFDKLNWTFTARLQAASSKARSGISTTVWDTAYPSWSSPISASTTKSSKPRTVLPTTTSGGRQRA
jgi:hypothetical protein